MRPSSIAAFAVGAVVALGAAYVVELGRDPKLGTDDVQKVVVQYLEEHPSGVTEEKVGPLAAVYLKENPDAVIDAIRAYQEREEKADQTARVDAMKDKWAEIGQKPGDPVLGNPDGDVTLVEFFDYRCGYCKRAFPEVQALHENDPKLKIVLKEFPILGPESVFASRASLAAGKQGLVEEFHTAAMQAEGNLTEERVMEIAGKIGLDVEQLRRDMESPEIDEIIESNYALAEELGIRGTPAFVTRAEIIPGAVNRDRLEAAIAKVRQKDS